MNSPVEERKLDQVTILISSSVDDVSRKGCLAVDVIEQTEVEVERLNVLKSGKMKELVFKKQIEPEEVYRGAHMDVDMDADSHQPHRIWFQPKLLLFSFD